MSSRSVVNIKITSISLETKLNYIYNINELFRPTYVHPQVHKWSLTHPEEDTLCKTYLIYAYRSI